MRATLTITAGLMLPWALTANDALDLLEGKAADSGPAVPTIPLTEVDGSSSNESWRDEYSWRWMTQLPPLWSFYRDESNPVVQEAALTGLFEWRFENGTVEADQSGVPDQEVNSSGARRARLGTVLRAFYNTDLEARAVFDGDGDYKGIDKLKATIHVSDDLSLSLGKFRPPFSTEYTRDPSVRLIPEMSPLVSQIVPANSLGVMVNGAAGNWDWGAGWFSGDVDRNLPGIEGNGYFLGTVGYTFSGPLGEGVAEDGDAVGSEGGHEAYQRWHLDYIYNRGRGGSASIPMGYQHLLATGFMLSTGAADLSGDFLFAKGDANTVWGLTLQGSYWILNGAVRAVARYSYADTDDAGALMVGWGIPSPTSDSVHPFTYPTVRTGDELHTFYGGLNFHLIGDQLILQTGVEYTLLKNPVTETSDFSSLLWLAGGRAAF